MKRLIVALVLVLVTSLAAIGQEPAQILYKDTFTLQYKPPSSPPVLLPGESLVYRLWLWDYAQGVPDATSTTGWTYLAETPTLSQYVVTPQDPRRAWVAGVQTVHRRADGVEQVSGFAHILNPADIDPAGYPGRPFLYAPVTLPPVPGKAERLRDSGT